MNESRPNLHPRSGFTGLLLSEFKARASTNPSYSLRAFAGLLKVDSSHLTKILKGNRSVSRKFVEWAGVNLNWEKIKIEQAKRFPDVSVARAGRKFRSAIDRRLIAISSDQFEMVSQLIHYSILELTELSHFKATVNNVAKRLRIPLSEVTEAVQRLKRIGALVETANRELRGVKHFTTVKTPGTSSAMKRLQKEILTRASKAVDEIPIEQRDQSGVTMAVNSAMLPVAKERIKTFRRELAALLQEGDVRDRVYQLSVSLFPLEQGDTGSPQ